MKNAILISAEKVMAPIPIPKFTPGFGFQYRYRILVAHYSNIYIGTVELIFMLMKPISFKNYIKFYYFAGSKKFEIFHPVLLRGIPLVLVIKWEQNRKIFLTFQPCPCDSQNIFS